MRRESGHTIFHTEASGGWGGQELRILAELEGLVRRGHRAGLICEPDAHIAGRARALGAPVYPVRFRWSADPAAIRRVAGILRQERVDVLGTHSSLDAWVGGLAARLCGVPVVRTRHVSVPVQRNPFSRAVYTALCDKIVTTGEAIRRLLLEQLRVSPAKVISIPTGVDLEVFHPSRVDPTRLRRELALAGETPLLGMVAVLRSWKGHQVFLQALRRVWEIHPEVRAVLVGDGPLRGVIQAAIRDSGSEARVHLLGHREDVADILAALDVVVSASTGAEGIPQALLQALAMGRAVVASDIGGIPEVIRPGETGWLVPPGDPETLSNTILEALADRAAARRMGEQGRKLVEAEFTLQRMGERLEGLYTALAPRCRGTRGGSPGD